MTKQSCYFSLVSLDGLASQDSMSIRKIIVQDLIIEINNVIS